MVQIWQLAGPQLRSQLLRYDVASDMITSECRPGWSQLGQGGLCRSNVQHFA